MLNLPRKEETLTAEVVDGASFELATLEEEQLFRLLPRGTPVVVDEDGETVRFRVDRAEAMAVFNSNVRGADGVEIDGEPFDPENEDHLRAVKPWMKIRCASRLVDYEMQLPGETAKNSEAPARPSRGDGPRTDSAGASNDS